MADQKQVQQALETIKAIRDDGTAEINGRHYTFTTVPFKEARMVFAYYTEVQNDLKRGSMWFLESPDFARVEEIIMQRVLFNGSQVSKLDRHWDNYPEDYVQLIQTAMMVIAYPFLPASLTGSESQAEGNQSNTSTTQTLKKPVS